jgi:hypothetical protein
MAIILDADAARFTKRLGAKWIREHVSTVTEIGDDRFHRVVGPQVEHLASLPSEAAFSVYIDRLVEGINLGFQVLVSRSSLILDIRLF